MNDGHVIRVGVVVCSGFVGELCGLAFWRRQDSSVQNDADVASAETAEGFGSLSGHEGKQTTTLKKPKTNKTQPLPTLSIFTFYYHPLTFSCYKSSHFHVHNLVS